MASLIAPETLTAFIAVSLLLCIAPGPDNLFVLTQSALYGRVAGLRVTLGLCSGLVVHTAAVALGIAALIKATPQAFILLKLIGATYLFYLAWHIIRVPPGQLSADGLPSAGGWQLYQRGILMNVSNPKVTLFFLALLPQFADPARSAMWLQIVLLGVVFMLSTLLVFGAVALLAGSAGQWLGSSLRAQRTLQLLAGMVYLGLALRLLVAQI